MSRQDKIRPVEYRANNIFNHQTHGGLTGGALTILVIPPGTHLGFGLISMVRTLFGLRSLPIPDSFGARFAQSKMPIGYGFGSEDFGILLTTTAANLDG